MKKFFESKVPELIALCFQIVALCFVAFVKPCSFSGFTVGLLMAFITTKIMSRIAYNEKKSKKSKVSPKNN